MGSGGCRIEVVSNGAIFFLGGIIFRTAITEVEPA